MSAPEIVSNSIMINGRSFKLFKNHSKLNMLKDPKLMIVVLAL